MENLTKSESGFVAGGKIAQPSRNNLMNSCFLEKIGELHKCLDACYKAGIEHDVCWSKCGIPDSCSKLSPDELALVNKRVKSKKDINLQEIWDQVNREFGLIKTHDSSPDSNGFLMYLMLGKRDSLHILPT